MGLTSQLIRNNSQSLSSNNGLSGGLTSRLRSPDQLRTYKSSLIEGKQDPTSNMSDDELYQKGLEDFTFRGTERWQKINKEKTAKKLQEEQDKKPGFIKAVENLGSKMKETMFGKDLQREVQTNAGTNMTSGNKGVDVATNIGGSLLGYAMPVGTQGGSLLGSTSKIGQQAVNKLGGKVTNTLAQKAIKGAVEAAPLSLYSSATQGEDVGTAAKRLATETAFGAAGEVGAYGISKGYQAIRSIFKKSVKETADNIASVVLEEINPNTSLAAKSGTGTYKIKNTGYTKALDDYNSAIKTIQDHFGTNQLRVDEVKRIKSELGIDLEEITDRLAKYETKTSKEILSESAEKASVKRASGLGSDKEYSVMQKAANQSKTAKSVADNIDNVAESSTTQTANLPKSIQKEIDDLTTVKTRYEKRLTELRNKPQAEIDKLSDYAKDYRTSTIKELENSISDIDNKIKVNLQRFAEANKTTTSKTIPDGIKQSKFAQTVADSQNTSPELSNAIDDKDILYKVKPNEQTLQRAKDIVDNNYDEAVKMAKDPKGTSAEHSAVSQLLIQKAQQDGRWQDAIEIVEATTKRATNQGQAIQALSMWNRLTPEGMLKYAQNVADKANKNIKNPGKKIKLTDDLAKDITDRMKKINDMADGREKTVETAKVLDKIHSLVPADLLTKISSIQTMAQLLNPKTAIRNLGGNALFAATENLSKLVGVPIDTIVSKVTGQRSVLAPSLGTQVQGFKKGFNMGLEDALKGIDTTGLKTQFDMPSTKVFKGKILGGLETAMNVELKATDRGFYQAAFEDSLKEQMKIAKASVPDEKMVEIAHLDGLYRTFQDKNAISNAFTGLKRVLNGGKQFGLGDFIMKYPKTPANILARGIDYSPVGIAKGVIDLAKIATESGGQRKAVQELSRGVVGSGLIGAGMVLAKTGILTGKTDKDADARDFKKEVGLGGYKLNLSALQRFAGSGFNSDAAKAKEGDTIMNYDWLQPTAMGLSAGANISDKQKTSPADVLGAITTTIYSGMDTLAEQPVLSGLLNVFNGYDNGDKLTSAIQAIATGAPSSFIPTFVNQVRQMTDNTSRNTNSDSAVQKAVNLIKNKIPGLSKSLPENVSTTGETKEMYQDDSNNLINVFLNPAFVSKYKMTSGTKLLLDLYDKTGEVQQFPRKVSGTITINGKKVTLTNDEKATLQKEVGNRAIQYIEQAAKSAKFNNMSDEKKIEAIRKVLDDAGTYGRNKIIKLRKGG